MVELKIKRELEMNVTFVNLSITTTDIRHGIVRDTFMKIKRILRGRNTPLTSVTEVDVRI